MSPLLDEQIRRSTARSCRIGTTLLFALTMLGPAHPAAGDIPAAVTTSSWVEVKSPNFRVISNAGSGRATSVARRLEQFTAFLAVANPGLRAVPTLPTEIYLFDRAELLDRYRPRASENILAFASHPPGRNFFVLHTDVDGEEKSQVLCHEYVHAYNFGNFAALPLWLNEGLAEYYGTFRMHGRNAEVGRRRDGPMDWMKHNDLADFDLLFAFKPGADAYTKDNPLRNTMYAQGWLMTHYFEADPARAEKFGRFLTAIAGGTTPANAFEREFPRETWPALRAALRSYAQDDFLQTRDIPFRDPTADLAVTSRPIDTSEALADLGRLLVDLGPDRSAEAEEHLRQSVALAPGTARAWAALGRLADERSDSAAAESDYRHAMETGADDPRTLMEVALGTQDRLTNLGRTQAPRAAVEAAASLGSERFSRCLAVSPDDPEAQAGVARTFLYRGHCSPAIVHMAEAAAARLPSRRDVAFVLDRARELAKDSARPDSTTASHH